MGDLVRRSGMHNGDDTARRGVSAMRLEPKDSSRGDEELARGVYTLANDLMYDWLVAFLESMQEHEPDLPIVVIPFDDRIDRVARLCSRYSFAIMDDPVLAEIDRMDATVRDYLAMGLDPERSVIFLQSEVPAIAELTFLFAMLVPFNRVMRNPTLKDEIKVKNLGSEDNLCTMGHN